LITSLYACVLSFHNVLNRYLHSMAAAQVLPASFARVHPRHRSPHVAAVVQVAIAMTTTAVFALVGLDPVLQVFTWFGGVAMFSIVVLMAVASLAVIVYLSRGTVHESVWRTWVAPGLAFVSLLFIAYLQIKNFPLLLGEPEVTGRVVFFCCLILAFPLLGVVQALWLRSRRPSGYRAILEAIEE
jgi:amino acid transporter